MKVGCLFTPDPYERPVWYRISINQCGRDQKTYSKCIVCCDVVSSCLSHGCAACTELSLTNILEVFRNFIKYRLRSTTN